MNSSQFRGPQSSDDDALARDAFGAERAKSESADDSGSEGDDPAQKPGTSPSDRERTFARRALIQAGWSVPIITGLVFPRNASANSHPFIDHHDFVDRHPFP
jgi:hypothetical protein